MTMSRIIASFATLAALTGMAALPGTPGAVAPQPAAGARLYVQVGCAECHGYAGQGGSAGPRLAGKPLPIEAFRQQLRHPADEMPPYSERVLSAAQIDTLQGYVATLR